MKHSKIISALAVCLLSVRLASAGEAELNTAVRNRSERALLEESTAAEQAAVQARNRSGLSLELRPGVSQDDVRLALRICLPDRWGREKLREQLVLVAQSEQLRVAALEWQQLLAVYRDFCTYRLCRTQLDLYAAEQDYLEPWLEQADHAVEQHQLAGADRTRLYSLYLGLLNDREKVEMELVEISRQLKLVLGNAADLDLLAQRAVIAPPAQSGLNVLVEQALANRADYRLMGVQVQSLNVAEEVARAQEGFRLKHVQPEYQVNHDGGGGETWGISAAFVLPWGTRNPDVALYQQERALAVAAMDLYRQTTKERLLTLLQASDAFGELAAKRRRLVLPLLEKVEADLGQMNNLPMEQLRDLMAIRGRILDTALLTAETEYEQQRIAVDVAEELGSLGE